MSFGVPEASYLLGSDFISFIGFKHCPIMEQKSRLKKFDLRDAENKSRPYISKHLCEFRHIALLSLALNLLIQIQSRLWNILSDYMATFQQC